MTWTLLAHLPLWAAALVGLALLFLAVWFGGWLARHDGAALVLRTPPETVTAAALQRRANELGDPWEPKPEQPRRAVRPLREPMAPRGQGEGGKAVGA